MRVHRRRFLQLTGATLAAGLLPASIVRALEIPANNRTGSIMDVEHVVILMQENRSFDHYYGMLAGARGFGDRITIPLPDGRKVWEQTYTSKGRSRTLMPYHLDKRKGNALRVGQLTGLPHTWPDSQQAWDNGRMADWPSAKTQQAMGYYTEAEVEYQYALARAFTLCDQYHAAMHAGTNPNRIMHWTGSNDPAGTGGGPVTMNEFDSLDSSKTGYRWTTYPERLQAAGVSWKVYQNLPDNFTDNPLAGFRQYRAANEAAGNLGNGFPFPAYKASKDAGNPLYKGVANTMPEGNALNTAMLAQFAADAAAGSLPQVSWIIAPAQYSEHPGPSSPLQGAWYVQQVLDILTADPALFARTVFLVNFDENDGFFDHVPPPCAPSLNSDGSLAGDSTLGDIASEYHSGSEYQGRVYGPGPRVPMLVISPWSRGGWVNSQSFDHTSVLRFLEARFGVAETNISAWRRTFCGDLTSCFNFVDPNAEQVGGLPVLNKFQADTTTLVQGLSLPVSVPSERDQRHPQQPQGVLLARPLPYELHATARAGRDRVRIAFACTGDAGAVFHAYDRLHLDRVPRRYGVEAGKMLDDLWSTGDSAGRYDLWVMSTNGWLRHFAGDNDTADSEIKVCYDPLNGELQLVLYNFGSTPRTFVISDNAYGLGGPWQHTVAPGRQADRFWSLKDHGHWYDFSVTLADDAGGWLRRAAGRMETGLPGITDPAMGR